MNSYEYKPLAKHDDLVVQEIGDEILIYDLKTNKALCLNQISAIVWKNCNGKNSITQIGNLASVELKTLISEALVEFTIEQIEQNGLLNQSESIQTQFAKLSRREAVRRIGFSGVVALPIITAFIAPTSANAQSGACLGNNQFVSCDSTGPTCSQFPFLGPNAWRCVQPLCCSGTCVNADTTMFGLTACD